MEFLQQYDFEIVYLKGELNVMADALSRTDFMETDTEANAFHMSPYDRLDELDVAVCSVLERSSCVQADWARSIGMIEEERPVRLKISADDELRDAITSGYSEDAWCKKLLECHNEMPGVDLRGTLLFFEDRLVIPRTGNVRQTIFALAHNTLGHFGFDKSYEALRFSFYWPGMRTDLEKSYVPSCEQCQRFKSATTKPIGPLHPLPIPDHRFEG